MDNTIRFAVAPALQEGGVMLTSAQLAVLAEIAGTDAIMEMTSFHQLYVEMPGSSLDEITLRLEAVGLEVYPVGFVTKSLIACHFCRGAEESGLDTAQAINQVIAGIPTPYPMKIGYAGCPIATSEPLLKDIGIVKMRDTFDIYIGGEAKTIKELRIAELFRSNVTANELLTLIPSMIQAYAEHAKNKERFHRFLKRNTLEQYNEWVQECLERAS
ncbi:nitrite reductase [Paenibacillus marinisediminis]